MGSGIDSADVGGVLNDIAEELVLDRPMEAGERRTTAFDGVDESYPFGPDENLLQARFMSFLRWAIKNVRSGAVQRLSNVERRHRDDRGDGVSSDQLADRTDDGPPKEFIEDVAGLLARKEADTGLPLVDLFRDMIAGSRTAEQRKRYGDTNAWAARRIIVSTVEEYGHDTGNQALLRLLARVRGEGQQPRLKPKKASPAAAPAPSEKERDYASILSVLDRLGRPAGTTDLGKYRRRWLDYPPRDPASGHKNRMDEVLANMIKDGLVVARLTRQRALRDTPGPNADAYRQAGTPADGP